jgi:hypothetical protein
MYGVALLATVILIIASRIMSQLTSMTWHDSQMVSCMVCPIFFSANI